ncbi:MAG: N-acetylglucosamine-6-phosphate deacetylase [Monoglobaceae bacterium]
MANKNIWIGNGKVVFPDRVFENGSLLISDGVIAAVNEPCPAYAEKISVDGKYIMPGFIDLHVHGGGGSDFMDAEPEAMQNVCRAHCMHGTTALFATTMTCEDDVLKSVIDAYKKTIELPICGAQLMGLHLEGPFFSSRGRGAQPVGEERIPTKEVLYDFIRLADGNIKRWDEAPELENTDLFAKVMQENNILPSIAHTSATADIANMAFDLGIKHITHFYSATTTGQKIDGIVYSGVNEAVFLRDDVTIEVIADGRHIPKEHMLLAYKIKGADNMALITDAMRAAGTDCKTSMLGAKVGGVPVVIKNGVAQLLDLSSYAGSIGTMDKALRVAHLEYGIPLIDTVKMLSKTPARIMNLDKKGELKVGNDADVVIMDDKFEVAEVYVCGRELYKR